MATTYIQPIQLTPETLKYISNMTGNIKWARSHPQSALYGVNPEFWLRLLHPTQSIKNGDKNKTHLMSYIEEDGKYYIYPQIQEINGKLVDLSSDWKKAWESAKKNNNFIIAPNKDIAENFSAYYKESQSFPEFQKYNPIKNLLYNNTIQKNLPLWNLYYKLLRDEGYSDTQTAAILANLVVESQGDPYKQEANGKGYGLAQWTTDNRLKNMFSHIDLDYKDEGHRQIDFLAEELKDKDIWNKPNTYKKSFELQRPPFKLNTNKAITAITKGFENPKRGQEHLSDRLEIANYFLSKDFLNLYTTDLMKKSGGKLNYLNYIQ